MHLSYSIFWIIYFCVGWCSSVSIVSGYGLKDGGSIFNLGGEFPLCHYLPGWLSSREWSVRSM